MIFYMHHNFHFTFILVSYYFSSSNNFRKAAKNLRKTNITKRVEAVNIKFL